MAFYLDMTTLINKFATTLTVLPSSDDGEWVDGEWVTNTGEPVVLNEPFTTFNINSTLLSGRLVQGELGDNNSDKAYWFSKGTYPVGTRVIHNGVRYRVTGIQNFTDYSNVVEYQLETEGVDNGVI